MISTARTLLTLLLSLCVLRGAEQPGKAPSKSASPPAEAAEAPKPASHETRSLEGWTIHIDQRLLEGPDKALGGRAVRLLGDRLYEIKLVVPAERVRQLQEVPIWLDLTHGKLKRMQYHPSAAWLRANGYATNLVKCAHIPVAAEFANPQHHRTQPWCVLHELAHAYHDRVLGFEHEGIKTAWLRAVEGKKLESVLRINGRMDRHYALMDQKEFFAEMTEAYFGMNDFYPFNRAELQQSDPETFKLLREIWEH
ncbi:MAG: metallopeptidase [Verrucomicrobiota bacterium]